MSQPIDIIEEISNKPGAYGLTVLLTAPLPLEIGKFDRVTLKKGLYFYGGSAFGPGGLKARLARHIRPKNSLHWHIDHLNKGRQDILHRRSRTGLRMPAGGTRSFPAGRPSSATRFRQFRLPRLRVTFGEA
jgi:hypothetical protein